MSVNFYKLMRRLQWGTHLGLAGGKRVKKKLTDILLMNEKVQEKMGTHPRSKVKTMSAPEPLRVTRSIFWKSSPKAAAVPQIDDTTWDFRRSLRVRSIAFIRKIVFRCWAIAEILIPVRMWQAPVATYVRRRDWPGFVESATGLNKSYIRSPERTHVVSPLARSGFVLTATCMCR